MVCGCTVVGRDIMSVAPRGYDGSKCINRGQNKYGQDDASGDCSERCHGEVAA